MFIIGGAFGFDQAVYERANEKVSLSNLTFSHQMIRLFFLEQLYRIASILKGEKYHHK
uniref:SPOUT methyltransferase, predicted n=1 Tax=uncultured Flavobacteriia bacterium TaxID=212695 RepID=H6RGK5_9BACT|nr:SPOUT methyltransferase, predicted [uncultured Flavobacteriia bacterium]